MGLQFRWITLCSVALACGGGQDNATVGSSAVPSERPVPHRRILFIGTSLTAGYGLDPDQAFPSLIASKIDSAGLPFDVVNAGVSGETSAGARRRIDWLLRDSADVIVLETGANDGLRALNIDSTRANIHAILSAIRAARPGAELLVVQMEAPPNLGPAYTSRFRAMYPELAREFDATLVPFLLEGVAANFSLNQDDGIHPNAEGAARVAENVWKSVGPVLRRMMTRMN